MKYHPPAFLAGEKRTGLKALASMGSSREKRWHKTNVIAFVKALRQTDRRKAVDVVCFGVS